MNFPIVIASLLIGLIFAIFEKSKLEIGFVGFALVFIENAYRLSRATRDGINNSDSDFRSAYALVYSKYIFAFSLLIAFFLFKFLQFRYPESDLNLIFLLSVGLLFAVLRMAPSELFGYFDRQKVVATNDYRLSYISQKVDPITKQRIQKYLDQWASKFPNENKELVVLTRLMSKTLQNSKLPDDVLIDEFQKADYLLSSSAYSIKETISLLQLLYDKM